MSATQLPHPYESGVGHMTAPEDVIGCCDRPAPDPIHVPKPTPRACGCDRLDFRHLWHPDRCPPHPDDNGAEHPRHAHPHHRYEHDCRACRAGVRYDVRP